MNKCMAGLEIVLKLMWGMLMLLQFHVALDVQLVIRYAFPFLVSTDSDLALFSRIVFHVFAWPAHSYIFEGKKSLFFT